MPDALSMALRVATTPIWLLWRGYLLLWWAFDDSSERAVARLTAKTTSAVDVPPPRFAEGSDSSQGSAFEVVDSRPPKKELPPPMPVPTGLLRGGFVGSMALCSMLAIVTGGLSASNVLSGPRAGALWAWACTVVLCGSVLLVRGVARKRWERPKGAVARAKDACVGAAKGVCVGIRNKFGTLKKPVSGAGPTPPKPETPAAAKAETAKPIDNPYGAAAFRRAVKSLVPAVARGARGVLDPLRDRASKGFAWAAEKSRRDESHSKAA